VQKGERVVSVSYEPFGSRGTALALTAWYLAVRRATDGAREPHAEAIYQHTLTAIQACVNLNVAQRLSHNTVKLFPPDADALLDRLIVEEAPC
jgi:hypothetical protein